MDINITYTAKDGTQFHDPYECEEYEKRLGTKPGSVARARIDLKALGENRYVFGLLKVRHKDVNHYLTYVVRSIDDKLEDYVNVSDLDVDKRWIRNTISDVLHDMEKFNDDDLCEYEFLYCNHWSFGGEHPFGCTRTHNQKLWDEMEKAAKSDTAKTKK
jgi:hypothetical protein